MNREEILDLVAREAQNGIEVYADYRDCFEDHNFKELQKRIEASPKEKPLYVFYDYINDLYEDYSLYTNYVEEVKYLLSNEGIKYDDLTEDLQEECLDVFRDNVIYNMPYDHYLGQRVCIDIVIDAGDANYCFTINDVYPHYNGDYDTLVKKGVPEKSCISWLAKRQKITKTELKESLSGEKRFVSLFLPSLYEELRETTSSQPSLTFMKSMTVEEWLNLLEKKYITISEDIRTGLVDFENGAGGLLEIKLDRGFKFDKKFIYTIQPDCCFRYGVLDIYGATEALYD